MIPWICSLIGITGSIFNIYKSRWGFIFWAISNMGFIVYFIYTEFWSQVILFIVNLIGAICGFIKWSKE